MSSKANSFLLVTRNRKEAIKAKKTIVWWEGQAMTVTKLMAKGRVLFNFLYDLQKNDLSGITFRSWDTKVQMIPRYSNAIITRRIVLSKLSTIVEHFGLRISKIWLFLLILTEPPLRFDKIQLFFSLAILRRQKKLM